MFPNTTTRNLRLTGTLWLFAAALLLVSGCGSVQDQSMYSGSIFQAMSISGNYKDGLLTNQVDIQQVNCETDPTSPPDYEFYGDHFVQVGFVNRPLPNAEEQTASVVYLKRYEIRYTPLDSVTAPYPLASPLVVNVSHTFGVPPCEPDAACTPTELTQVYFVPVATKDTLRDYYIMADSRQLAYDAHYTFYGENDFGEPVTATAQYNFYVDNYNYCD